MKKLALLTASLMLSTICAFGQNSFTIKGTTSAENNGKMVYLFDYHTNKSVDSARVKNATFEFRGSVGSPTIYRLNFDKSRSYVNVIAENELITVELGDNGMVNSKALNSKNAMLINRYNQINERVGLIKDSLGKLYPEDREAFGEAYSDLITPMVAQLQGQLKQDMLDNCNNMYGVYCLWELLNYEVEGLVQFDSLVANVPLSANFGPVKAARDLFVKLDKTKAGRMFVDFAAKTADGAQAKLSDFVGKGKYVLVDFWASWCGPCKAEIPNLREIHQNYPDLVVLGVNVWDKHEKFIESIEKEGMTWRHLYASDNKDATDLYGIQGIPTIILFAPDGTIVDRTLRGKQINEKLDEVMRAK